jgi:hypothetical protein
VTRAGHALATAVAPLRQRWGPWGGVSVSFLPPPRWERLLAPLSSEPMATLRRGFDRIRALKADADALIDEAIRRGQGAEGAAGGEGAGGAPEGLRDRVRRQLVELSPTCGAVLEFMERAQPGVVSARFLEGLRGVSGEVLGLRDRPQGVEYAEALLRTLRVLSNGNALMVRVLPVLSPPLCLCGDVGRVHDHPRVPVICARSVAFLLRWPSISPRRTSERGLFSTRCT